MALNDCIPIARLNILPLTPQRQPLIQSSMGHDLSPEKLLDRVREAIHRKHASLHTAYAGGDWITRFIALYDQHPCGRNRGCPEIATSPLTPPESKAALFNLHNLHQH